jgi:hypothetical protein
MKKTVKYSFILLMIFLLAIQNSIGQDEILFRKHIINSGWNGLYYGVAIDIIAELDGAAAAGIPVITAGSSMLLPLLVNTEKAIDYDALVLSGHGKSIGWAHGMALATLIGGEKAFWGEDEDSDNYKYSVGLGAITSIGMGILGNSLAKNNEWTEGQVELYRLYGWLMPFTGFSVMASFADEPRLYGGAVLLFGAGGYLIADRINSWNEYTRGEMRANQVLTTLNLGLGVGVFADLVDEMEDVHDPHWLIPAAGAVAGTLIGHLWLKDTKLTPQQGMLTAYAAGGGAILGLGIALITESDEITPYYLIPYATGLGAYAFTVERLRKRNNTLGFVPVNKKNNLQIAFMPQNLFLNNKIQSMGYQLNGKLIGMQPVFSASVKF